MKTIDESTFNETIKTGKVVVDFTASWCGPCKTLAPRLKALAETNKSITFVKVDIDESEKLASKYSIKSIPTLVFFADGKKVARLTGLHTKAEIATEIKKAF